MRLAPFAALLAAAAATLSPPPPIHVAFASDLEVLPGLVVALASLANATASIERVRVHVVSVPADAAIVRDVVACALPTLAVEVHAFEAPLALPRRTRPGDERLLAPLDSGQEKRAKFPTSKAPISAIFHSIRLIFGRAIISRNGLEAWMCFP